MRFFMWNLPCVEAMCAQDPHRLPAMRPADESGLTCANTGPSLYFITFSLS
jgi:hypothetical protein